MARAKLYDQIKDAYEKVEVKHHEAVKEAEAIVNPEQKAEPTQDVPESSTQHVEEKQIHHEEKIDQEKQEKPVETKKLEVDHAPSHWSNEDKEVFNSLDNKGREFLVRRHREMEAAHTKRLQALSEEQKVAKKYKELISPHEGYFKDIGIKPEDAVNYLINAEKRLRLGNQNDKQEVFNNLHKTYGYREALQAEREQQVQQQIEYDPKLKPLYDAFQEQQRHITELKQERENQRRQAALQEHERAEHISKQFSNSKDKDGNLKYPHFEKVKGKMGDLFKTGMFNHLDQKENGLNEALEKAYRIAISLDEELHSSEEMEYISKRTKEEEAKKLASASKNAGFNVKSSTSAAVPKTQKRLSLRDSLIANFEAQQQQAERF